MKAWLRRAWNGVWPNTIKWQLITGVALVHAVLMSIFIVDLGSRERHFLLEQLHQQTASLARTIASNSVEWVLSNNVSGLQEIIASQENYPGINYVFILSSTGKILAHTNPQLIGKYIADAPSLAMLNSEQSEIWVYDTDKMIDFAVRIYSKQMPIGWVRLSANADSLNQNLQYLSREGLLYTLLAILVGSLFAYLLGSSLTRRIRQLIQATQIIDPKKPNKLFQLTKQDEVGDLMHNFNQMQNNLYVQHLQVQKQFDEIQTLAFQDSLTGLDNRLRFEKNMLETLKSNQQHQTYSALLFFDLDNFKQLNDTHGHHMGDQLLIQIANRVEHFITPQDFAVRFGGDEFILVFNQIGKDAETATLKIKQVAQQLLQILAQPYKLQQLHYQSTVSIGLDIIPPELPADYQTIADKLKRVDIALYASKEKGRNQATLFESSMQVRLDEDTKIEKALETAIDQNLLTWLIQPQYNMQTQQLIGGEILCRWQHEGEWIPPYRFIPIAENRQLIGKLTQRQIISVFQALSQQELKQTTISINLSPLLIFETKFIEFLHTQLEHYQLEASQIKLEITEGIFIDHYEQALSFLSQLKAIGFKISLDDFGTGFSSLSYLKNLPIDELKIDKSFVDDLPGNTKAEAIAKTIIDMTQNLNIGVLAEGVETEIQRQFLLENECHYCQGYLYSKPIELEAFIEQQQKVGTLKEVI